MTDPAFAFGRCELIVGTRELRVDGQARAMQPLTFDLLVYLLRHRHRAVTKDELLDQVWLGRIVTPAALARAITTVRQAIEDDGQPPLIQTLHRVGYRFTGRVVELAGSTPGAPVPAAHAPIVVALLPLANETGELAPDGISIGLMELVGNGLATDARLALLPERDVAAALRGLPADADLALRAAALRRHGRALAAVHTRIVPGGPGYQLDYQLSAPTLTHAGTLLADDPIRLGRALASRLRGLLLARAPSEPDAIAVHDTWAAEVFEHAVQAWAEGNLTRAAYCLRVALDLEPDHREAQLLQQRIEALRRDEDRAA